MRLALEALISGDGRIQERLQLPSAHFGVLRRSQLRNATEVDLYMRIASSLVEGGDEGDVGSIADSITALDESRAGEIAIDMLRLYEVICDIDDESKRLPAH